MSGFTAPRRIPSASRSVSERSIYVGLAAATLSVAALAIAAPSAFAQSADAPPASSELPPVEVQQDNQQGSQSAAPKPKPAAAASKPKPAAAKAKPKPYVAPAEPVEAAPVEAASSAGGQGSQSPGANPYANPDAPYKVESSGSGKFTQPLVDTPKTITAISKDVIKDKGATDLRELARQTPGVIIHAGEGGGSFGSNFEIRGFNARNDIFVDGIRDPGNIGRDTFSIEQLEIYKGPSGTISGRATPGGAFNFITKQPDFNFNNYEVETTVGTDSTFRTTIDVNQIITQDFAVRGNVVYDDHEFAGRDYAEDERWGGLLSAAFRPTDNVQVNLDYYRIRREGIPDAGVPVSRVDKVPFTELGLSRDTFYGELGLDHIEEESDVGTATIKWKVSDGLTITNTTRYGENMQDYLQTAPRPNATQLSINGLTATTNPNRIQETSLFANQTLLNAKFQTGSFHHDFIAGVDYSAEKIDRLGHAITTKVNPANVSIRNPNAHRDFRDETGSTLTYSADIDDVGFFIGDTVHLNQQWIVNGAIRYDDFTRDQVGGPTSPNNTAKVDAGLWSWNVGLTYKPIPIASIYAAYGYTESPIGNEVDSTGGEYNGLTRFTAGLPPEETTGVELGTKWELFDRRLLATAAIFETTKDNARTNRGVNNAATDPEIGSAGKYRVRGSEFGLAGNITEQWSVFGGIVVMSTEALQSDDPSEVGKRLANTPLTQFALLSKYALTPWLTIGGQAVYQSEFIAGHFVANQFDYHSKDYWRFDALAEIEINKNWSLELTGTNLTDETYYDAIYQAENTFAYVAPGRAGYLTVKWKY